MGVGRGQELLHMRLKSCIQTVVDVHQTLKTQELAPELEDRFHELKQILVNLDVAAIDEGEVARVESATNYLLSELKPITRLRNVDSLSQDTVH